MSARTRRMRIVPLLVLALSVLSVSPVLADTEIGRAGDPGRYWVWEGVPWQNGNYCRYNVDKGNRLDRIGVRAPGVFARDTTAYEDSQTVGWRVIIKRQKPGQTTLATFYRSATARAVATDAQPALFPGTDGGYGHTGWKDFPIWVPREHGQGSRYWIFVRIFWYDAEGNIQASVTSRQDVYYWMLFDNGFGAIGDGWYETSCFTRRV